jgi:glutamine synthetase
MEGGSTGLSHEGLRNNPATLPDNIYDAIDNFSKSAHIDAILGEVVKGKFADLKRASADRCPRSLGSLVKTPEIQYHHEVTNQVLWKKF